MIKQTNDQDFQNDIKDGCVLVDFYADWCGPCRMLSPIIEQVAEETNTKTLKVNVDECEQTAKQYGILSIPTIIVFKDGQEVKKNVGLCTKEYIEEMLK